MACVMLIAAPSISQKNQENLGLPELHKIKRATLSPSYGCRSAEDFAVGYGDTALFLSAYSKKHNSPELLFDGACNSSSNYFSSATAGDFLDVIADFGSIPLEELTASDVFGPHRTVDSMAHFREMTRVEMGHTYAVLINKDTIRGFFFFRVTDYAPQKLDLEYVVMDYSIIREELRAPGFDWSQRSRP
jgi:hypothetical protein